MSSRGVAIFAGLLALGLVVRIVLAFATYGIGYDIDSLQITAWALHHGGAGVYDTARWPYPGGFLPVVWGSDTVARHTGLPFHGVIQVAPILADMAIAWLVMLVLRWRGASERRALFGAALVALGSSFIVISGYHGQIDSTAVLPALAAAVLWQRDVPRRALYAGLLIGLAAAVKQPLIFTVVALIPTSRSWRERVTVVAGAVVVPVLSIAPFLATNWSRTVDTMGLNSGVPGFGGVSAFVQPSLTRYWATLQGHSPPISDGTHFLVDIQRTAVAVAILAAGVLLWRRRVDALTGGSFIWLTAFVVNPNFAYQYLIWGLPFFLAAGYLRHTAAFQIAILPATLYLYWRPGLDPGGWAYLVAIQAVWLALAATLAVATYRLVGPSRRPRKPPVPALAGGAAGSRSSPG